MKYDYTRNEFEACLRELGVVSGDNLFIHSNIGFFGRMEGVKSADELCAEIYTALKHVVTESGTIVLPAFSYSFCHNEVYNPLSTKSDCGMLSEYAIRQKDTIRSMDPNFSIVAWGNRAKEYTENPPHESFGEGSFWSRILASGGKIVCMNYDCGSTFVHYVEKSNSVPYRYNKAFNGVIRLNDGQELRDYAVHFVCDEGPNRQELSRLNELCKKMNSFMRVSIGKGSIIAMDIGEYYEFISKALKENPRFLTIGD